MNSASAFCWARAPARVAGVMAPASVNGVATTAWPWLAISMSPSDIGPSRRSGVFELMIVIRLGRCEQPVAIGAQGEAAHLDGVVDHDAPGAQALPRLVELGDEDAVHLEVPGRHRQVGRLERTAALLVDDVEGADEPHVVAEVGGVARPTPAVEVGHEGRPADGPEDDAGTAERRGRAPGCERAA